MQNAMFSALFGALTNEHRMNAIANNLANVNTTGYKRDMIAFRDTLALYAHDQIMEPIQNLRAKPMFPEAQHMARPRMAIEVTDFQQGGMKVTGAPFDLAISGEGFFKVESPEGIYYTRNGHFRLNSEGMLITEQGYPVQSDAGPITVPEGVKHFTIAEDGRLYGDNELLGQIDIVGVENEVSLEKLGHNLFKPREGAEITETEVRPRSFIAQGFLEAANVDAVYEMVNMIEAQRQYEAYAKIMQSSQQMDQDASQKVGKGR